MEEALAPQAHHIAAHRERRRDLIVGQPLGGEQDHFGSKHLEIRQRILAGASFQYPSLLP
jgi:hypothetical protein